MRMKIYGKSDVQSQWNEIWESDNIKRNMGKLDYPEYWPIFEKYIYCLLIHETIEAIIFICEVNDIVYFENITYNKDFAKYGLGIVLYDYVLKDLINAGKTMLYLGDGNQEYKRRFCGENQMAFDGVIYRHPVMGKIKQHAKNIIKRLITNNA